MILKKKFKIISLVLGTLMVFLYITPYCLLGENAFITIHDFLDLTIGHLNNIVGSGNFFKFNGELPLMDGVARSGIPFTSPFELKSLCFFLFPGYWAVVLNILIVKIVAFIGMFLLLDNYFVKNRAVSFGASIAFFLIPFYVDYSFSSAGIPLLLYAFLNLYNKKKIKVSLAIVFLYGLNSALALSGIFVCFLLFVAIVVDGLRNKKINKYLAGSLVLLGAVYLLTNWTIIYSFFIKSDFESNRIEMVSSYTFSQISGLIADIVLRGYYHSGLFNLWVLLTPVIVALFICRNGFGQIRTTLLFFISIVVLIAIGYYVKLIPLQLFKSFRFERFHFMYPAVSFILFAKSCDVISQKKKGLLISSIFIFLTIISVVYNDSEFKNNIKLCTGKSINQPTYAQFYGKDVFNDISDAVGVKQDYSVRVISLGLFPSVAEYNGFWCLDGYLSSYSLDYKHKFRRIIERELQKDDSIKQYFDDWGNRCYIFSSELGRQFMFTKDAHKVIKELEIDTDALRNLSCQYVFSAVEIANFESLGMVYKGCYNSDSSYYTVYVYQL